MYVTGTCLVTRHTRHYNLFLSFRVRSGKNLVAMRLMLVPADGWSSHIFLQGVVPSGPVAPAAAELGLAAEPVGSRVPPVVHARGAADASLVVPGLGVIAYYSGSNRRFQVICLHEHHSRDHRCVKTRQGNANPRAPAQGRPLGYFCAWLQQSHAFHDKASHCEWDGRHGRPGPTKEERLIARAFFRAEFGEVFENLESFERERYSRAGDFVEDEEPDECP